MKYDDVTILGIRCPQCGVTGQHRVDETFQLDGTIRRRRKCLNCGVRFVTYEQCDDLIKKCRPKRKKG